MHPLRKLRESGNPTPAQVSELLAENILFNSPMFGTTRRRKCDHDGAFQIGSTQEYGWSVVSDDLGYISLEAKTLLRRRSRVDRCTDCVGMIGPSRDKRRTTP